jgi:hypothetical protein
MIVRSSPAPVKPLPDEKHELPTPAPKRKRAQAKRRSTAVPASHHARIRTLTAYGMTLEQVAEHYGVGVGEIERILAAKQKRPGDQGGTPRRFEGEEKSGDDGRKHAIHRTTSRVNGARRVPVARCAPTLPSRSALFTSASCSCSAMLNRCAATAINNLLLRHSSLRHARQPAGRDAALLVPTLLHPRGISVIRTGTGAPLAHSSRSGTFARWTELVDVLVESTSLS